MDQARAQNTTTQDAQRAHDSAFMSPYTPQDVQLGNFRLTDATLHYREPSGPPDLYRGVADFMFLNNIRTLADPDASTGSKIMAGVGMVLTFLPVEKLGGIAAEGIRSAWAWEGLGNITHAGSLEVGTALEFGEKYLGAGYSEVASGVFRSADEVRQFRMMTQDITGAHGSMALMFTLKLLTRLVESSKISTFRHSRQTSNEDSRSSQRLHRCNRSLNLGSG
jgi:hypothetical protein